MTARRITVLMSVFNGEAYLDAAIGSILGQSYRDFDFLIVDDGSTDGSAAILARQAAADPRITVIRKENAGLAAALNAGLAAIDSEYVARMDADDVSLPTRLAQQLAFLDSHPEIAVVGSRVAAIEDGGGIRRVREVASEPEAVARALPLRNAIVHPSTMMRTAVLRAAGGYREEFRYSQDYDLWLRLVATEQLANMPDVLLHYRTHARRASANTNRYRQTIYSVAAAADYFLRSHAPSYRRGRIDVSDPAPIADALTHLLGVPLPDADRNALYRHALRLVRDTPRSAATTALARRLGRDLARHREWQRMAKLGLYLMRRPARPPG